MKLTNFPSIPSTTSPNIAKEAHGFSPDLVVLGFKTLVKKAANVMLNRHPNFAGLQTRCRIDNTESHLEGYADAFHRAALLPVFRWEDLGFGSCYSIAIQWLGVLCCIDPVVYYRGLND